MNAYEKATSLIKIRPHFSGELAKKLSLRGFSKLDIEKVINQLTEEGLLDDSQFAQIYLDNLIKYKTFGFYGLKAKLMQRGIANSDAEVLLKEKLSMKDEKKIAERFLEKEKKPNKLKLAQKLSRKGFRTEIISSFLQDV